MSAQNNIPILINIDSTETSENLYTYTLADSTAKYTKPGATMGSYEEIQSFFFPSSSQLKEFATGRSEKDFKSLVPREEGIPISDSLQQQGWFIIILFLLFIGYGFVISQKSNILYQDLKDFFHPKSRNDMFSDSIVNSNRVKTLLYTLSFINLSFFCYFAINELISPIGSTSYFSVCMHILLVLIAYVIFKIASIYMICYIFFDRETFHMVKSQYSTLVSMMNLCLFPIVLLAAFATPAIAIGSLYIGAFICIISTLLYLYKIIAIFFNGLSSLFYLILYLCTLEILPTIALIGSLLNVM